MISWRIPSSLDRIRLRTLSPSFPGHWNAAWPSGDPAIGESLHDGEGAFKAPRDPDGTTSQIRHTWARPEAWTPGLETPIRGADARRPNSAVPPRGRVTRAGGGSDLPGSATDQPASTGRRVTDGQQETEKLVAPPATLSRLRSEEFPMATMQAAKRVGTESRKPAAFLVGPGRIIPVAARNKKGVPRAHPGARRSGAWSHTS